MLKKVLGIAVIFVMAPAFAADVSYSYLGGGYQRIKLDNDFGPDPDGDGVRLNFSFDIANNWYLTGEYGTADLDFGFDLDTTSFGVGYHAPMTTGADIFAVLTYEGWDLGLIDEDGFGAKVGVRGYVADRIEASGHVKYIDLGDFDDTLIGGEAFYEFTDRFAVGVTFETGDVTSYGIAGRFYFNR